MGSMMTNTNIGTRVTAKTSGLSGLVEAVDVDTYATTMLIVSRDDGAVMILKPSEVTSSHPLSWSCGCEPCVEARRMLGRAFSEVVS